MTAREGIAVGRLLRVSVVLDGRADAAAVAHLATLVGRIGLDGCWLGHPGVRPAATDPADLAGLLHGLRGPDGQRRAGVLVDLAGLAEAEGHAAVSAAAVAGVTVALAGSPPRVAAELGRLADGATAGLMWPATDDRAAFFVVPSTPRRDLDALLPEVLRAAAGRPVAVAVPVSVGRTAAEAHARADREPAFLATGHPRDQGLFGTLEQCQDRVVELAHAGVTEVLCHLPLAPDLPDVLAQLTAVAVGSREVHRPGAARSPAPPPPLGWGGRRPLDDTGRAS